MSKFGRDDVKDFIRNFQKANWEDIEPSTEPGLLNECGCEDSEYDIHQDLESMNLDYSDLARIFEPMWPGLADSAMCPESYNKTVEAILQDPNMVLNLLKPALTNLGIGCPASMAKAVGDVLGVSQETGITPVFSIGK